MTNQFNTSVFTRAEAIRALEILEQAETAAIARQRLEAEIVTDAFLKRNAHLGQEARYFVTGLLKAYTAYHKETVPAPHERNEDLGKLWGAPSGPQYV